MNSIIQCFLNCSIQMNHLGKLVKMQILTLEDWGGTWHFPGDADAIVPGTTLSSKVLY